MHNNLFDKIYYNQIYDCIIEHQKERFKELEYIIKKTFDTTIIIPGKAPKENEKKIRYHTLGTDSRPSDKNESEGYEKMLTNLDNLVSNLFNTYNSNSIKRVIYDNIGEVGKSVKNAPSYRYIHVWSANEDNWNLNNYIKINGDEQASAFNTQKPGVFGIVTTINNKSINLMKLREILLCSSNTNHLRDNEDSRLYILFSSSIPFSVQTIQASIQTNNNCIKYK